MKSTKTMAYFHDLYDQLALSRPDSIAVVSIARDRQSFTYAAVRERSLLLAAGLNKYMKSLAVNGASGSQTLAVHLPRTHPEFVPLLVAASRVGLPFVLLSTDLPDRALQESRNLFTVRSLKPCLCVSTPSAPGIADVTTVTICELLKDATQETPIECVVSRPEVFSFMFTGGTSRTKCVEVTHAMVLHERSAYSELWQPSTQVAVVLAHTSVYWGASALGQLSIALAYSGTVVWTEASEAADLRRIVMEERVNILGVVPDHLDLLAPESPIKELPGIEVVFTWGERLPRRTADRWRKHPRAVLRELLIATEYWLCLWADPLGEGGLQTVRGTKLLVLNDKGTDAVVGEVGELMISGPMVMAGYRGDIGDAPDPFYVYCGERFFRTRDLVNRTRLGVVFKGRADMMTKHKGKWVDMTAIEDELCQLDGVHATKVMPDPVTEHFHAFVVLEKNIPTAPALSKIRRLLPPRLQLWLVPELPRHPVTRKVDVSKLSRILAGLPTSWPIDGNLSFPNGSLEQRERFWTMLSWQVCWQLVAFGTAWAVADGGDLDLQLSFLAVYVPTVALVNEGLQERNRVATSAFVTSIWVLTVVFYNPPTLTRVARSTWSCIALTYSFLTLTYADGYRNSLAGKATMAIVDEIPFWKFGAFILVSLGQHLPGLAGGMNKGLLLTYTCGGMVIATWRRRFFSWPTVFWGIGVGNQLSRDCHSWVDAGYWYRSFRSRMYQAMYGIGGSLLLVSECFGRQMSRLYSLIPVRSSVSSAPLTETETVVSDWQPPPPKLCTWCGVNIDNIRWPAVDESTWPLCDSCGANSVSNAEAEAAEWLSQSVVARQQADAAEPLQKVRRTDNGSNGHSLTLVEPLHKVMMTDCDSNGNAKVDACVSDDVVMHHDGDTVEENGKISEENGKTSEDAAAQAWYNHKQFEGWWWRNKTADVFDLDEEDVQQIIEKLSAGAPSQKAGAMPVPPEMQLLCTVIGEISPLMKPVHLQTELIGMDSLQVARLTNNLRIQFGIALTVQQIREAKTVGELADIIAKADVSTPELEPSSEAQANSSLNQEYAVWYSPGQYKAMGYWVLRSEEKLDHAALVQAGRNLADRHEALRVLPADPLRYMSMLYDNAVVYTLYAPFLSRGPAITRFLRRIMSKAFADAWPRVKCYSREELYKKRFPDTLAPIEILQVDSGQDELERLLRQRRNKMAPPGIVTAFELRCCLCDVWAMEGTHWRGRFVIMRAPAELVVPEDVSLVYVDAVSKEWGPLIGPGCSEWQVPPYGFPALFFVPLSSGGVLWIRLEKRDELRICYREQSERSRYNRRLVAFRAAPQRPRDHHPPVTVSFLSIGMFHCFADGNCYLPLVQDFLNLYGAAKGVSTPRLPALSSPFEELQRRLFDTFHCRQAPMRSSLRGSLFGYRGVGFGYCLGIGPSAVNAITRTALHFRVPLDVALLGAVVCAMARADHSEFCDFTLYAPMRDGAAEAMSVALFSDWRDLYASVDFDLATVLGTILQLYHKIQTRQWTPFNALRKPERTVINIQPLDFEKRMGFKNLGENMWRDGDRLNENEQRTNQMGWAQQPATFVIEQQDEDTWWVLVNVGADLRPAPWLRGFVEGFRDALYSFLYDPLTLVHRPLPDDDAILRSYTTIGKPLSLKAAV